MAIKHIVLWGTHARLRPWKQFHRKLTHCGTLCKRARLAHPRNAFVSDKALKMLCTLSKPLHEFQPIFNVRLPFSQNIWTPTIWKANTNVKYRLVPHQHKNRDQKPISVSMTPYLWVIENETFRKIAKRLSSNKRLFYVL